MVAIHAAAAVVLLLVAGAASAPGSGDAVAFANALGSSMVLQQAPAAAQLWGRGPPGSSLALALVRASDGTPLHSLPAVPVDRLGHWRAKLPPVAASTGQPERYSVTAAGPSGALVVLEDIVFGDVIVCSGQSNMQFSVGNASNATAEIAAADALSFFIRVMTVGRVVAEDTEPVGRQRMRPQRALPYVEQRWSRASAEAIGGPWGSNFSAVCYYFGKEVYKARGYPIGLISANWGSSTVETWMSPSALSQCADQPGFNRQYKPAPPSRAGCKHLGERCTVHAMVNNNNSDECCGGRCFYYARPPLWPAGGYCDEKSPSNSNTQLFDNIITPLLSMTIRGVVWYQGESDTGNEHPSDTNLASANYACMISAMVNDWRARWSAASGTSNDFPFGIVQLSSWGVPTGSVPATGESLAVAATRWGQTANYGYAPNPKQPNTFLAVAVDLGAFRGGCCAGRTDCSTFPSLCIHPWWKQEVGRRLALGMRNVGYSDSSACHQGPFPISATASAAGLVKVSFGQQSDGGCGSEGLELRRQTDFELKLAGGNWSLATISAFDAHSVSLKLKEYMGVVSPRVDAVRYLWSTSPGSHPPDDSVPGNVSVYGKGPLAEALPAPPFFMPVVYSKQ